MIYWTPRKLSRVSHESPAGIKEELSCAKQPASCAVKPYVRNMLTIMIIGLLQICGIHLHYLRRPQKYVYDKNF